MIVTHIHEMKIISNQLAHQSLINLSQIREYIPEIFAEFLFLIKSEENGNIDRLLLFLGRILLGDPHLLILVHLLYTESCWIVNSDIMNLLHYSNVIRLLKTENNNKYIVINYCRFFQFPLVSQHTHYHTVLLWTQLSIFYWYEFAR
jgi:hypothetical protein